MKFNLIDRIGDWNPQLLRELKGRLKPRNVIIVVVISLVGQVLLFLSLLNNLNNVYIDSKYCSLQSKYEQYIVQCPENELNMQLWWQDYAPRLFLLISVIAIFVLLVAGTFMLIHDLSHEERSGTLNFLRFSPRSSASILIGKILGVPILVYLAVILAIPLHLWLGIMGQIPIVQILSLYVVLVASCVFFYSAALLCSLVIAWFSGFQSWLISGAVFCFLCITNFVKPINQDPIDWISLFNPCFILTYLVEPRGRAAWSYFPLVYGYTDKLQWFFLPLGETIGFAIVGVLLNYAFWTYCIWQGLKRCFRNPNAPIISKGQSYWLVFYFSLITLGFALQEPGPSYLWGNWQLHNQYQWPNHFNNNFAILFLLHLGFIFGLMAMLLPHRQHLQDWARYRHQQGFWNWSLWQDLLFGEKSPAQVAMGINLLIFTGVLLPWILVLPKDRIPTSEEEIKGILAIAFFFSIMIIYASIVQLMLMMRNNKRSLYATATIIAAISLPPTILSVLRINPSDNPIPWLLSTFPWMGMQTASVTTIFLAFLGELSVLALINLRFTRQLQQAGESATKALLAGRN